MNGLLPRIKESLAGDVTNVVALGADTLDGRATLRYEFPVSIPGLQLEGQTSVWVDAAPKLPVQAVSNHSTDRVHSSIQVAAPIP